MLFVVSVRHSVKKNEQIMRTQSKFFQSKAQKTMKNDHKFDDEVVEYLNFVNLSMIFTPILRQRNMTSWRTQTSELNQTSATLKSLSQHFNAGLESRPVHFIWQRRQLSTLFFLWNLSMHFFRHSAAHIRKLKRREMNRNFQFSHSKALSTEPRETM